MGIDEPLSILKPWPCFIEQKNPKLRTMFYRATPSIFFPLFRTKEKGTVY